MNAPMVMDILIPRGMSIAETIVHEVARLAEEGKIKPGEKFPTEAELAETWKVGRSSIREAFRIFQMLGVTEAKPGRGTVLLNTAPLFALINWGHHTRAELIGDIIEARLALEPIIAAMAARRADAEAIRRIEQTIEAGRRALGNEEASIQASLDFHTAVAAAAGNQTLLLTTRLLRSLYQESARLTRRYPENYSMLLADHEEILRAIRNKEPDAAAKASEEHMRHGLKIVFDPNGVAEGKSGGKKAPAKRDTRARKATR
ncbi:MAG: FCD domain-containing protein [Rhodospirillales bacterium]|nr:FCD domain-containing protein [Rhodospirillales bacterium]